MAYLIDSLTDTKVKIRYAWYIARPINNFILLKRISDAWGVFIGKYDAVRYMTESEHIKITIKECENIMSTEHERWVPDWIYNGHYDCGDK